jgi:beta-glucosidase/6-phospho-beta-glucosidase/beta-galactosidase
VFRRSGRERLTKSGWAVYPKGLYKCLKRLHNEFGLPMYITENGIATEDDVWRAEFIRKHLKQVGKAIAKGMDVRGYFYWSNLDNFEWSYGFEPTFGLVAVDYADGCKRTIRESAWAYTKIIEERGLWVNNPKTADANTSELVQSGSELQSELRSATQSITTSQASALRNAGTDA